MLQRQKKKEKKMNPTSNFIWIVKLSTVHYIFLPKQSPILDTITFYTTFCINILSFVFYSQTTIVSGGYSFQQKYRMIGINLGNKFHQLMSFIFYENACIRLVGWFMVSNATFKNISAIQRWSVLLVEETGGPRENH